MNQANSFVYSVNQATHLNDIQFSTNRPIYSPTSTCSTYLSNEFDKQQRRLRFEIIIEAATAITQKSEEAPITYLNRGQLYAIQLRDKYASDELITSTLSIDFHLASHRLIADSYWKYWLTQQKQPESRAIDIDTSRSIGISKPQSPSFDKITFNWNGKEGCKLYVRFRCLSTDFSRIKGVKGIPLRVHMDTMIANDSSVNESCFCKVKLFRDKGAERKNKDDYKQIVKQLQKLYGNSIDQSLPLLYNVSIPYSVFGEIPLYSTVDAFEHALDDFTPPTMPTKKPRCRKRISHPSPNLTQDLPSSISANDLDQSNVAMTALTPCDYFFSDSDTMSSYQTWPSIYDVFTPEEIQQPPLYPLQNTLFEEQLYKQTDYISLLSPSSKRKLDLVYSSDFNVDQQSLPKKYRFSC